MNPCVKAIALLCCLSAGAAIPAAESRADSLPGVRTDHETLPPDAPSELKRLVGEYGSTEDLLTIYEAGGHLFADGRGLHQMPLRRLSAIRYAAGGAAQAPQPSHLDFELDGHGQAVAVLAGGKRLPQRDIGRETVEQIQAGVNKNAGQLRKAALAATPPAEPAPKRASELIDLATVNPTIKFDIRYASSNNFIGFPLYERAVAYMQRPAAEALGRAAQALAPKGYGLLIHDGYRPWFVTKMFWDATPETSHVFVADPSEGSRHNRGCAVDLTLYDLKSGKPVEMTGRYDEMSHRSYADYVGGTSRQRWLRELLRNEMEAQGFSVYPQEWWHFDYKDWRDYAIGTATFAELGAAPHATAH